MSDSPLLTSDQIATFADQGYLRGPRILSDDQTGRLQEETLRVIRDRGDVSQPQPVMCHNMSGNDAAPVWQIVNIWQASDAFRELVLGDTVASLVAQLMPTANELRIWHDQIQYKPAVSGGELAWHQDSPYWGILTPKDQQVTAWIALDDVNVDNGCMQTVPRSQHWGNAIEFLHKVKKIDDMRHVKSFEGHDIIVKTCPVARGEIHFHHSLTWHGSGVNHSGRPRRAIALHFVTDQSRYLADQHHVMKQFVKVANGEVLKGDTFPLVWSREAAAVG